MKKIVLLLTVALSLSVFGEDDPLYSYIDVPYTCVVNLGQKAVIVTLADGTVETFYYCSFVNSHLRTLDVATQYANKYGEIQRAMASGGISNKFYGENMAKWDKIMKSLLYEGQVEQQKITAKELGDLKKDYEANRITEEQYQQYAVETYTALSTVEANYEAAISGVSQKIGQSMESLETMISSLEQQQKSTAQNLQNELIKQSKGLANNVEYYTTEFQKLSIDLTAAKKSIAALEARKLEEKYAVAIPIGDVRNTTYTNDMNAVSQWLGSESNLGFFTRPVNPVTSNKFDKASNIATWMNWLGVVGYCGLYTLDAYMYKTGDTTTISNLYITSNDGSSITLNPGHFYEWDNGGTTNTFANFRYGAPTNWVDGVSIVASNGYYEAVTKMNVQSASLPVSHESHQGEVVVNPASGKKLIFRSAQDSDVRVDVSTNQTGDVILTFGVYWK